MSGRETLRIQRACRTAEDRRTTDGAPRLMPRVIAAERWLGDEVRRAVLPGVALDDLERLDGERQEEEVEEHDVRAEDHATSVTPVIRQRAAQEGKPTEAGDFSVSSITSRITHRQDEIAGLAGPPVGAPSLSQQVDGPTWSMLDASSDEKLLQAQFVLHDEVASPCFSFVSMIRSVSSSVS
jgi:hypothetical protein